MRKIRVPSWTWIVLFFVAVVFVQAQTTATRIRIVFRKQNPKQGGVADVVADSLFRSSGFNWTGKILIVTPNDSTATPGDSIVIITDR
jgi:hypothetical protein